MATLVLVGLLFLILAFFAKTVSSAPLGIKEQEGIFILTLLFSGAAFTSTIFSDLGDGKKASGALTLPASHVEKYLVNWVYSYLLFQLVFVGAFYLALLIVGFSQEYKEGHVFEAMSLSNSFDFKSAKSDLTAAWILYAFWHAIMLWGAITFKKWHFIKTGMAFILFIILLAFLNYFILDTLLGSFGHIVTYFPFSNVLIEDGTDLGLNVRSGKEWRYFPFLVLLCMASFFWVISYFKLKEKQI
ncbi:hypothetical protein [Rufibacter sp. DG15C]|uniref:hypothetical protein n=1 Tax=Rufibacter sp. DG15C TaxID=1379909 RepID=UPI0018D3E1FF|nr:hypothetical protein [Rufibacter sp. DG15C]